MMRVQCTSRFCWGAAGVAVKSPPGAFIFPPNSHIEFEVKILSHSVFFSPPSTASLAENVENEAFLETSLRKLSGNRWYRYGDFTRAARCYSKAAEAAEKALHAKLPPAPTPVLPPNIPADLIPQLALHLEQGHTQETDEPVHLDPRWVELLVSSLNNLAASHLQTDQPLRAREACIRALEVLPNNITTLLRAGR